MNTPNRYAFLVSLLLCLLPWLTHAAGTPAGLVLLVSGTATAQLSGDQPRTMSRRSEVYVGDRITTGNDSQLQLRMKDGAMIALGANAEFVVKAYSDDAAGDKKDEAVLSLVKGGLRTISGQIDKQAYSLQTPTATLGIRGTVFDVYVRSDGSTVVILRDGQVMVSGNAGGQQLLTQPGLATVVDPDKAPTEPAVPPQDVLDYLRGIIPDLPDNVTWASDGDGGATVTAGQDIINIINDHPPEIQGSGSVPGVPAGAPAAPADCTPEDWACYCNQNSYNCDGEGGITAQGRHR